MSGHKPLFSTTVALTSFDTKASYLPHTPRLRETSCCSLLPLLQLPIQMLAQCSRNMGHRSRQTIIFPLMDNMSSLVLMRRSPWLWSGGRQLVLRTVRTIGDRPRFVNYLKLYVAEVFYKSCAHRASAGGCFTECHGG